MNAVDTNVLVYAADSTEPVKQAKAVALLARSSPRRRWTRSYSGRWWPNTSAVFVVGSPRANSCAADVANYLNVALASFPLILPEPATLHRSLDLTARHSLSHCDSMLLAACLEATVNTLYSEDLSNGATYDSVKVVNPFA